MSIVLQVSLLTFSHFTLMRRYCFLHLADEIQMVAQEQSFFFSWSLLLGAFCWGGAGLRVIVVQTVPRSSVLPKHGCCISAVSESSRDLLPLWGKSCRDILLQQSMVGKEKRLFKVSAQKSCLQVAPSWFTWAFNTYNSYNFLMIFAILKYGFVISDLSREQCSYSLCDKVWGEMVALGFVLGEQTCLQQIQKHFWIRSLSLYGAKFYVNLR